MKSRTKQRILCLYAIIILSVWKGGGTSQVLPSIITKEGEFKITTSSSDVNSHLFSTSNTDGSLVAFCSGKLKADEQKRVFVYDVKTKPTQITLKKFSDITSLSSPIEGCGFINQDRLLIKEGSSNRVARNFKVASDGTVTVNPDSTWTRIMYLYKADDVYRYNNKNNYYLFFNSASATYFGDSSTTIPRSNCPKL